MVKTLIMEKFDARTFRGNPKTIKYPVNAKSTLKRLDERASSIERIESTFLSSMLVSARHLHIVQLNAVKSEKR